MGKSVSLVLRSAVFALGLVAVSGVGVKAQAELAVESYGLRLGYNTGSFDMAYSSFSNRANWMGSYTFSGSFGYHIGVSADIPFSEIELGGDNYMFGINPSVMFVSKGGERNISYHNPGFANHGNRGTYKIDAYYLDIPIPLSFKRDLGSYSVRAEFGPYIAIGLFGEQHVYISGTPIDYKESSFSSEGLSRIDGGVFYGVIVEFQEKFFVGVRSGSGLNDYKITSYYVTLGYNFKM